MKFLFFLLLACNCWALDCLKELRTFSAADSSYVRRAKHFKVYEFAGNYRLLVVKGEEEFLLANDLSAIKTFCPGTSKFVVPAERIIVTSTTHLPPFEFLDQSARLVGAGNVKLITSASIVKQVEDEKIKEIGFPLNTERIVSLKPDLIVSYVVESKELEGIKALERLNLPVVPNFDFLENDPLARAEWVKFFGIFLDRKEEASALFDQVESRYLELKKMAKGVKKSLVIAGKNNGETWYAPGAQSDFVKLLNDAGGDYLWKTDQSKGQITRNIEEVFSQIRNVDFWFPQNEWKSIRDALIGDSRYRNFALLKKSYVFNFNKKVNKAGGNDYWETAVMRPDLLLADLIHIMHPKLLPNHKLIWYRQLK